MPRWRGAPRAAVLAPLAAAAVSAVEALRFPALSFSSSLLTLRCLGPPPPSHRPPARLCPPPPPFHGEPISPALGPDDGRREEGGFSLASFRPAGEGGSPGGGGSAPRSVRCAGCVVAGRGGHFLFCSAAADAADAAVRETEPSMGPQPLECAHFSCGASARPSFENGGLRSASGCALTPARRTHRK